MKIFAISVIKNEADIIRENLSAASIWADKIFILDNGSTDGTWEIVCEMANDKIVPWKQDNKPFNLGLAGEVYDAFKYLATEGDWWCHRLDADEFYIDNPREFLPTISKWHQVVVSDTFQFSLTHEDIEEYGFEKKIDANIKKLNYYQKKTWSEARFFRHRKALKWESGFAIPKYIGVISPKHIRIRHFQYRSVEQILVRIQTRLRVVTQDPEHWAHATGTELNDYLAYRADLLKYSDNGGWKTEGSINQHYQQRYKRFLKLLLHRMHVLP